MLCCFFRFALVTQCYCENLVRCFYIRRSFDSLDLKTIYDVVLLSSFLRRETIFFCLVLWWSLLRNFYESCETTLKKPPFQPTLTTYGKLCWKPHTALPTLNREDSFCCWTSIMLWFMKQVCDFYDDKRWKTLYALVWNLYVFSFERAVVNKKNPQV